MFGLNTDPAADSSYASIDYAWYFAAGALQIYESGTGISSHGTYTTSTVCTITYDGAQIIYWKDGVAERTVTVSITSPLYLDSSFYNTTSQGITSVGFGPMGRRGTSGTSGTGFNTVANPADNRILTSDGTTNAANAEANLSFDGSVLSLAGQQRITKTAQAAGANDFWLELYSGDTGDSTKEISLRYHQAGQYYYQLRARSTGFRFTQGATDDLVNIYANNIYGSLLSGTKLEISRVGGEASIYSSNSLVLETDSNFFIGAYTARPLYINSANGASGTVYVSSAGLLGVGTTSPGYNVDIHNTGNATLNLKGAGTGYTQAAVILQSGTTDSPEARGLGVYAFNEGNDTTWYFGNGYQYADYFLINRKGSTTTFDATAAGAAYPAESSNFFSIDNIGRVGLGMVNPQYRLDLVTPALGTTAGDRALAYRIATSVSNTDYLEISDIRVANGADWYSSGYRIQQRVDATWMSYIQFNGGNNGGISIGTGMTTSSPTAVPQVISINASGTTSITGNVDIVGVLTATIKSFVIEHPTKPGKKLQYGVLEGPEHSVYVRGRLKGDNIIILPDHWINLIDDSTITVNLTPIGKSQNLYVKEANYEKVVVGSDDYINCYYTVFAERKDVDKLIIEY